MATNVQLPYHKPFTKSCSKLFQKERERERERERLDRDRETDADQQIHNTQASPRPTKNKTSPFNHHIKTKQKIHFKNLITR